jgi:transcriptional regulator with XRE-family HTH domain
MWMSHSGEECLYTESEAGIVYNMFWPRIGEDVTEPVDGLEVLCKNGQIVRILPNVPHWNSADADSTAWMAIRHLSGSRAPDEEPQPSNLTQKTNRKKTEEGPPSARAFTLEQVKDPSRAFILLSDFRGQLQVARQRAGLSIAQLSSQCDLHSTYILKAERGEANLSLLTVNTLARVVRLDMSRFGLPEYFPDPSWSEEKPDTSFARFLPYQRGDNLNDGLLEDGVSYPLLTSPAEYQHWLHPARCNLKKGSELRFCPSQRNSPTNSNEHWPSTLPGCEGLGCFGKETWIVLEGKLSFESDETELLLSPKHHPVLHLRSEAKGVLRAYEDSRLLRIVFSAFCRCRHTQPEEQPKP